MCHFRNIILLVSIIFSGSVFPADAGEGVDLDRLSFVVIHGDPDKGLSAVLVDVAGDEQGIREIHHSGADGEGDRSQGAYANGNIAVLAFGEGNPNVLRFMRCTSGSALIINNSGSLGSWRDVPLGLHEIENGGWSFYGFIIGKSLPLEENVRLDRDWVESSLAGGVLHVDLPESE